MPDNFFPRLKNYYKKVAEVLRGEAQASSIFPNTTDIGMSRERVYKEFLRLHAPSKCNVFFGGFVFGIDGTESKQLDILVTTDTTPKFDFHNPDGSGKSFSPVEGTLGVVSIKSTLNKNEIEDAMSGIASIPPTSSLDGRVNPMLNISGYEDWPYKVIYSTDGITGDTLLTHVNNYYNIHTKIPIYRRPNLIHVSGKYIIIRGVQGMSIHDQTSQQQITMEEGKFYLITTEPDLQGILWILDNLQIKALTSAHILYNYQNIINQIL